MFFEVFKGGQGEIVEKKSRFIATVFPISNENEAIDIIEQMKKKYWDARHNCYAYVCGVNNEVARFSDDGEPSQTAGKPMLDIILSENLKNILVVVTRYFGGELLGTGGLVRAYSQSTKEGIAASTVLPMDDNIIYDICVDYTDVGKVKYIVASNNYETADSQYGEKVTETVLVPFVDKDLFIKKITEATSARAVITEKERGYYSIYQGQIIKSRC
jgi:uncharacterized YigZ family protein